MRGYILSLVLLVSSMSTIVFGADTDSLSASPDVCTSSPCEIKLSWNIASLTSEYIIAIYAGNVWDDMSVHGLQHIGEIPLTHKKPSDSLTLSVVNMRMNYTFAVYPSSSFQPGTALAKSNVINFDDYNAPLYGRLSLTNDPTEMLLYFTSENAEETPIVLLGLSSSSLTTKFTGRSDDAYTAKDLCFSHANDTDVFFSPGIQQRVLMTDLSLDTIYYYQYGFENGAMSEVYSFHSNIGANVTTRHSAIVFADMGVTLPFNPTGASSNYWPAEKSVKIMEKLLKVNQGGKRPSLERDMYQPHTLLVHIGDISYARGYPTVWEYFMSSIQSLSTAAPYMVGIGNHEYDYVGYGQPWAPSGTNYGTDSEGECGVPYSARYEMPSPPSEFMPAPEGKSNKVLRNLWYSFDQGPVHYLMFSSEHNFFPGSTQYKFMEADLAAVDRSEKPWLVVMSHRPMYTSEDTGHTMVETLRSHIEPLLEKYDVSLYLCGHIHKYERSCSLSNNGTCSTGTPGQKGQGTTHVTIGMSGNTYQAPWLPGPGTHNYPPPPWSVFRTFQYGVAHLTANQTSLEFQFLGGNTVHDYFTLQRDA